WTKNSEDKNYTFTNVCIVRVHPNTRKSGCLGVTFGVFRIDAAPGLLRGHHRVIVVAHPGPALKSWAVERWIGGFAGPACDSPFFVAAPPCFRFSPKGIACL